MFDVFSVNGKMFASGSSDVYMSETGDRAEWVNISTGSVFPTNMSRTELSVCINWSRTPLFWMGKLAANLRLMKTKIQLKTWLYLNELIMIMTNTKRADMRRKKIR